MKYNAVRKIYAIGEALIDIIFRDGRPQAAKAGGSMLNTAVSLGRTGKPVYLVTEYGTDDTGSLIESFLKENGVDTTFAGRFGDGNTALALAFLDEKSDARYTFYKKYPGRRLDFPFPSPGPDDFLLYGSIYSVSAEIRVPFEKLITGAASNKSFLIYDPNFRKAHLHELPSMKRLIDENLRSASLVRGSDEDFRNIFGTNNAEETWNVINNSCNILVCTENALGVSVITPGFSGRFPVKKITPVSTIGAGDNFNAGMITAFFEDGIMPADLPDLGRNEWERIIETAVDFASNVCLSYDNYIDLAFASRYRSASRLQM